MNICKACGVLLQKLPYGEPTGGDSRMLECKYCAEICWGSKRNPPPKDGYGICTKCGGKHTIHKPKSPDPNPNYMKVWQCPTHGVL